MPAKPKPGIRWTISDAAREFGKDTRTLGKGLKSRDTQPGKDGKYTTRQIFEACIGDFSEARARKMAADAEISELEAAEKRGELVRVDDMRATMEKAFTSLLQRIKGDSNLDEGMKTELVDDLRNGLLAVK